MPEAMPSLRPHQILAMGSDFGLPYTQRIPPPVSGGMSPLDYLIFAKLLNLVSASGGGVTVFEFGTYLGFTTAFFSDYLAERAGTNRVFTLDLDSPQSVHFEGNDAALAHTVLDRPRLHTQIGAASVQELRMDSPLFRPERYDLVGQVQFCLVDANHALSYVEHDTKQALAMRDSNRPSVIVWDDYRHPDFPDLTSFLDSLTSSVPNLFHIEETNLAVAFPRGMTIPERVSGIRL